MSYYIRYVLTEDKEMTLSELEKALQEVNAAYAMDEDVLMFKGEEYGRVEINSMGDGDGICDGDIELLEEFAQEKQNKEKLLSLLKNAKCMVAVQPIWHERDDEETLQVIDPLFHWLQATYAGFCVEEGGVFLDSAGPIE